jgi:hypothetical protein
MCTVGYNFRRARIRKQLEEQQRAEQSEQASLLGGGGGGPGAGGGLQAQFQAALANPSEAQENAVQRAERGLSTVTAKAAGYMVPQDRLSQQISKRAASHVASNVSTNVQANLRTKAL